jgi:hypothetical protein
MEGKRQRGLGSGGFQGELATVLSRGGEIEAVGRPGEKLTTRPSGTAMGAAAWEGSMLVRRQGRDGLATVAAAGEGRLWH